MATILSLLAFAAYVAAIIGLAAGITWIVVKFTPTKKKPKSTDPASS